MKRETEPTVLRTPTRRRCRQVHNMPDVLAQMQRSGSAHFVKSLPKSAFPYPRRTAKFSLPEQFVKEIGDKIEELATLRVQTSTGRSTKAWRVHLFVATTLNVQIVGGWTAFVADNRLQTGDFVIFVLREDARSEFEVHLFRGPNASPYFPDEGERRPSDGDEEEEETDNQSPRAPRQSNPHVPRFSKRLAASNIGMPTGNTYGQFEFPAHFIRSHGERVHDPVKLQGIRENSRNYVMTCRRRPRNLAKVYFNPTEWSRFVRENDLKEGQELQFSLMEDSYFVVREISEPQPESQTCQCGFGTAQS